MAKLYQFPQGKEKQQIWKQLKQIKIAAVTEKRKATLLHIVFKAFYLLRYVTGVSLDIIFSVVVGLCRAVVYLTVIAGGFFLLIKYNTNGGVWDGSMGVVVAMLLFGCLGDVSQWHLFQRLLGVYKNGKDEVQ